MILDKNHKEILRAKHYETEEEIVVFSNDDNTPTYCTPEQWAKLTTPEQIIPFDSVNNQSTPADKVALFQELFCHRDDVYAKRWENEKKGTSGYSPVCNNQWSQFCPKSFGNKMKCGECKAKSFTRLNERAIQRHLEGKDVIGVYPLASDETCRFLAIDFDGENYENDVLAIWNVCKQNNIEVVVERSRSGNGAHLWIFFSESIPASLARKLGSCLITKAMNEHNGLKFSSYDRFFPNQDTMPSGGFGNLIALPLQKQARNNGNSVFVDMNFRPYADQWALLSESVRHTQTQVENFILQLGPELGELRVRESDEDEKPWEYKSKKVKLQKSDFPESVNIVCANMIYIEKEGLSNKALNKLIRLAAFKNPEFYKAQAMRLSTFDKPRIICIADESVKYLALPRGLEDEITKLFAENGVAIKSKDKLNKGRNIDVSFNGNLREEQQKAIDELLKYNNGILSATTAFGKTVVGASLIANRKVNTLILVHRASLLTQWIKRLNEFLVINEEPVVELTPTGRKRKKNIIGQIGSSKNNPSGIIDVATMQSLVSGDVVKDIAKNYGMVIVDECHHVSAFSFEQVMKATNAKYVYGLTATPTRKDGQHPIIYMHCGQIRYKADAKSQNALHPFEHYIIPRFTQFRKPIHRSEGWHIIDIYSDIVNSEIRNDMIISDVLGAIEQGRNPIILTERTEHVKFFAERLSGKVANVISLTGGKTAKNSREILQKVEDIPQDEPFVLIATGKYIGEGFDMPRLDTLFLAMPISWKGTLQQYVGRLHRLYEGKKEVQVYDYVDIHVPMLEKMYQKRLKGYAGLGYKAKSEPMGIEVINSIFDNNSFLPVYSNDIVTAQKEIIIVSPFLSKHRIVSMLNTMSGVKAKITVITRPIENYAEKDRGRISDCIELLGRNGIKVKTRDKIHQKFAIIDQRIVWYGSINLLSFGTSEESIMRIESVNIADELLQSLE